METTNLPPVIIIQQDIKNYDYDSIKFFNTIKKDFMALLDVCGTLFAALNFFN